MNNDKSISPQTAQAMSSSALLHQWKSIAFHCQQYTDNMLLESEVIIIIGHGRVKAGAMSSIQQ